MNVQYILFSFRDVLFCTADVEGVYCCLSTLKSSAYFSPANFTGSDDVHLRFLPAPTQVTRLIGMNHWGIKIDGLHHWVPTGNILNWG